MPEKAMEQLIHGMQRFRDIDPEMPMGEALLLLEVALHDGEITIGEAAKAVGILLPRASRYAGELGKSNRHHEEGYGLIEAHEDLMERRRKLLSLTKKGREFVKTLKG